jgi:hypothetical protein
MKAVGALPMSERGALAAAAPVSKMAGGKMGKLGMMISFWPS